MLKINIKTNLFFLKNRDGFSIVEVVVAFTIITIGMIGVFSLVRQNIQVENVNKNYLIASMLAQEGLELVRNARDANWLPNPEGDWYRLIFEPANIMDHTYAFDFNDVVPDYDADNFIDPDARLYIDGEKYQNTNGTSGVPTPFYRLITSTVSGADNIVDEGEHLNIICTVQWTERGQTHKYIASTQLYDWR